MLKSNDHYWRKEVLLLVNALPAIVNFISSLAIGMLYDFRLAGIWFTGKSICQLLAAFQPGLLGSILITKEKLVNNNRQLTSAIFVTVLWFVTLTPIAIYCIYKVTNDIEYNNYFLFYWATLVFYTILGILGRYYALGKILFTASIFDAVISLISLIFLIYISFEIFILTNAIKYILKGLIILRGASKKLTLDIKPQKFLTDCKALLIGGGGFSFKSWVATFCQYGDKVVLGSILTHEIMGVYGVGGTLAIPIVMISSSITFWAVPYIKNNASNTVFKKSVFYNLAYILLLIYPIFTICFLYLYGFRESDLLIASQSSQIVIALTIITLLSNIAILDYSSWKMFFVNFTSAAAIYAIIFLASSLVSNIQFSLLVGSLFGFIIALIIGKICLAKIIKPIMIYTTTYSFYAIMVYICIA